MQVPENTNSDDEPRSESKLRRADGVTAARPRRSTATRLAYVTVRILCGCLVLGALGVLAVVVLRVRGRARLNAALDRIRARGEPVRIDEIVHPHRRVGEEPTQWLEAFDELHEAEVSPAELAECTEALAAEESEDELWTRLEGGLDTSSLEPPTSCESAYWHAFLHRNQVRLERAREIERYSTFDFAMHLRDVGTPERPALEAPILAVLHATKLLNQSAILLAASGDTDGALRESRRALDIAAVSNGSPYLLGHLVWLLTHRQQCHALARIASLLPQGTDFGVLDDLLASLEPRAQLKQALLGERTIGNSLFEHFSTYDGEFAEVYELSKVGFQLKRLWFEHDQADYLDELERAIAFVPQAELFARMEDWDPRFYSLIAAMLLPRWQDAFQRVVELEAVILLTRATLRARSSGAEAAITWAEAQSDPFGACPLHTRLDADGTLTIWSVGTNFTDDGAPLPPWDPAIWGWQPPDILIRVPSR